MSITTPTTIAFPRLPMAETFFTGAILSHSLAHGYVLKGKSVGAIYNLALQVARMLNCKQRPSLEGKTPSSLADLYCGQCTDCRWVDQNSHPAVLTISRMTFQINDKKERPELLSPDELEKIAQKGNWPTLIKTDQVGLLIQQLGVSSEYSRVVIFTDAEELPASMPSDVVPPFDWRGLEASESKSFHIRPLERHIFNASSVNKFLKTLEEPPPRTIIFFIAETEEQLLETIVSRCQVVPCLAESGTATTQPVPAEAQAFVEAFLRKASQNPDIYMLGAEFEQFFIESQGLTTTQALETFQTCLRQRFLTQPLDEGSFAAYRAVQQAINTAQRMISAKTNEGQSLLNLMQVLSHQLRGRTI